ncbi:M23 family metallopeptidase [Schaalia suimastitidis]|uniref:M23 family metallopeptidase n=1 Tax=Schaalia suimastitidis TaxID=121163 RepID=UPI00047E278B|nr:M23 family metallopeptidase [Schaalia suimastitidis]
MRRTATLSAAFLLIVGSLYSFVAASAADTSTLPRWLWPTGGPVRVLRAFDPPEQPWHPGHRGVDLDVPIGSPVLSPAAGTVVYAGVIVDRPVVSIDVGGHLYPLRTTFEPVEAVVAAGEYVEAGQHIGYVVEGHSPGNLHWGAKTSSRHWVNPLRFLAGRSVLKPWDNYW